MVWSLRAHAHRAAPESPGSHGFAGGSGRHGSPQINPNVTEITDTTRTAMTARLAHPSTGKNISEIKGTLFYRIAKFSLMNDSAAPYALRSARTIELRTKSTHTLPWQSDGLNQRERFRW
jgi:hypothetical protein